MGSAAGHYDPSHRILSQSVSSKTKLFMRRTKNIGTRFFGIFLKNFPEETWQALLSRPNVRRFPALLPPQNKYPPQIPLTGGVSFFHLLLRYLLLPAPLLSINVDLLRFFCRPLIADVVFPPGIRRWRPSFFYLEGTPYTKILSTIFVTNSNLAFASPRF